jgi:hypothetical protein
MQLLSPRVHLSTLLQAYWHPAASMLAPNMVTIQAGWLPNLRLRPAAGGVNPKAGYVAQLATVGLHQKHTHQKHTHILQAADDTKHRHTTYTGNTLWILWVSTDQYHSKATLPLLPLSPQACVLQS